MGYTKQRGVNGRCRYMPGWWQEETQPVLVIPISELALVKVGEGGVTETGW